MSTRHRCDGCRFWSEMMAQAIGGAVEAVCLSGTGPKAGQYTTGRTTCVAWRSGHHGAVDCPPNDGERSRAAYAADEAAWGN